MGVRPVFLWLEETVRRPAGSSPKQVPTNKKPGNNPGGTTPHFGAGNGARTRDIKLGKLALYQLSYARDTVKSNNRRL